MAVRTDDRDRPAAVRAADSGRAGAGSGPAPRAPGPGFRAVLQIREVWRIDDEWWREPVSRLYFDLVLENGRRAVLYRDLVGGGWYRQKG